MLKSTETEAGDSGSVSGVTVFLVLCMKTTEKAKGKKRFDGKVKKRK